MPSLSFPWLSGPICGLIALNLLMHYYHVCTVPPGFADDPPREAGSSFLWAKKKGPPNKRSPSGVTWSSPSEINITKAAVTKCKKCGQLKPEVSFRVSAISFL